MGQSSQKAPAEPGRIAAVVEAMLFASDSSLTAARIAKVGDLGGPRHVKKAVETLNSRYEQMGCAFCIEQIAGGYQMMTRTEYNDILSRLLQSRRDTRLTKAAMETLAVVAYRQPVMRADVEAIRGVACGDILRGLMEKQLVKIVGKAPVLGHPLLYGTTRRFLETFGLAALEELPDVEQLRGGLGLAPGGDKAPPPKADPRSTPSGLPLSRLTSGSLQHQAEAEGEAKKEQPAEPDPRTAGQEKLPK